MLTLFEKLSFRSKALSKTRDFFSKRGFLETDVSICNPEASVDAYIDLFEVKGEGFLHSSPELRMKDLLANGSGNIYFLGHVFRKEEVGSRHSSEFTMLEYYRVNTNEKEFLDEVIDYISGFLGKRTVEILCYEEAFEKFAPKTLPEEIKDYTEQEKQHYIFSIYIEPHLGKGCYTIITDFPEEEASLAQVVEEDGKRVAKRYEVFVDGVELANGFFELSCSQTARARFLKANKKRIAQNKAPYPLDESFLANLEKGLPNNTYGIAIGFDRLLMLALNASNINDVILASGGQRDKAPF
ncbi:MAG: Elongation factor P--(R)-beta-lysine ligase [Chlamydiia bacterium]|nr:Elongation factor P--(R)-beta-lysine ligase [Chlamydiia bacterium]